MEGSSGRREAARRRRTARAAHAGDNPRAVRGALRIARRRDAPVRRTTVGRVRRRASDGQDGACRAAAGPAARRLPAHRRAAAPPGRRCGHRHRRAGAGRRVPRGEGRSVVVVLMSLFEKK